MPLATTYLNERLELLDAVYGQERKSELDALCRLYNRRLGPISAVTIHRPDLLDLSMYSSSASHSPVGSLVRDLLVKASIADSMFIPGGGKGGGIQQPFLGALGELAERLLAVLHFEAIADDLLFATFEDLTRQGLRALGPEELPLFAPAQYESQGFGYVPFCPDTRLCWIEGSELFTGEPILVPAQLVLLYYKHRFSEARIGYPTTGGLAFHRDRRRAILHGLYEVIERDAINVRWYSRLPPPEVNGDLGDFLVRHCGDWNPRISSAAIEDPRIYLNSVDVPIPVFTAVAIDRSRRESAFLGGGGAWSDRERALTQTLFELGQTRTALKFYRPTPAKHIRANSRVSEMSEFFDATAYFGFEENLSRLTWYTAGQHTMAWDETPTLRFDDDTEEYQAVSSVIQTSGLTPIALDFTGACWQGVWVTKVFIPQLTQACVPSHPYLGHHRFYELPRRLGLCDRVLTFEDLNSDPAPFP